MLNKVQLIGNLGRDPELRSTQSGVAVANFSIATSERWKDQAGEKQEKTEWHNVVVWKQQAESCGRYLHKGSKVYVEGRLQTRKWQDKEGLDRYTTEVVAMNVVFLDPKQANGSGAGAAGPPPAGDDDIPF